MKKLSAVLRERRADQRPALPVVLKALENHDLRLLRSQMVMIVGQPGSGKSMLALFLTAKLAEQGTRVLYLTADTDSETQMLRAAAIVGDMTVKDAFACLGSESGEAYLGDVISSIDQDLIVADDPSPTLDDVELEILAAWEAWGDYPEVVVVDVLSSIGDGGDEEWSGMRSNNQFFHSLSRKTGACFIVCHHVSEARSKEDYPAPLGAVQGRVNVVPEQVWSVALTGDGVFRIAAVKNRHGQASKKGDGYFELGCEPERMTFYESEAAKAQAITARQWK